MSANKKEENIIFKGKKMNELIEEFNLKQAYLKNMKHTGVDSDCKLNASYDCDLCELKRRELKREFIFKNHTHYEYIEEVCDVKKIYSNLFKDISEDDKNKLMDHLKNETIDNLCKSEKNIWLFLKENGEQKTKDIIKTIEDCSNDKYFKVTKKMQYCLRLNLLKLISFDEVKELFNKN